MFLSDYLGGDITYQEQKPLVFESKEEILPPHRLVRVHAWTRRWIKRMRLCFEEGELFTYQDAMKAMKAGWGHRWYKSKHELKVCWHWGEIKKYRCRVRFRTSRRGEHYMGSRWYIRYAITPKEETWQYQMRVDFATGSYTRKQLGEKWGKSVDTVTRIVTGRDYKYKGGPIAVTRKRKNAKLR